jgi:protein-S-isoprenylcysteine O-methyltransferase Ste14
MNGGGLALGLGAVFLWLAALTWSRLHPARRLWPPIRGNIGTASWAWCLTLLIYVGMFQTEGALDLPPALRWGLGGALSIMGSLLHSWGTIRLGLAGTSGWPVDLATGGPYSYQRHPQYLGQILMVSGLALLLATPSGLVIGLAGAATLVYAARVEEGHLLAQSAAYARYRERIPSLI